MKKSELIKALQEVPGDPLIIMARDSEGNGFSHLTEFTPTFYTGSSYDGEIWEAEEEGEETPANAVPALCLWPGN